MRPNAQPHDNSERGGIMFPNESAGAQQMTLARWESQQMAPANQVQIGAAVINMIIMWSVGAA